MNYYVSYTENCSMKLKKFSSKSRMQDFVIDFLMNRCNNGDSYIDFIFSGDIIKIKDYIKLEDE